MKISVESGVESLVSKVDRQMDEVICKRGIGNLEKAMNNYWKKTDLGNGTFYVNSLRVYLYRVKCWID